MDYIAALMGKKTAVEVEAVETDTAKIPPALGMMAKMLGVTPESMIDSMTMIARVGNDLASIKHDIAVMHGNQQTILVSLSEILKDLSELKAIAKVRTQAIVSDNPNDETE